MLHAINEEWLFGEVGSHRGQFPIQFIDHVPNSLTVLGSEQTEDRSINQDHSKPGDKLTQTLTMWGDEPNDKVWKAFLENNCNEKQ